MLASTTLILLLALQSYSEADLGRHIENLGSGTEAIRFRAVRRLIEIGRPAISALERAVRTDPARADAAGKVLDQIRWGVELHRTSDRFRAPDPDLFDPRVLKSLGMTEAAAENAALIEAIVEKMREHDASMRLPTGASLPLSRELHALDQLRSSGHPSYDTLEKMAVRLEKQFPAPKDRGRIYAMVAHVYGQSGCKPRTVHWARKALQHPIDPVLRLRMYEYWYSATLLQTPSRDREGSAEVHRALIRPSIFGYCEASRYDLPPAAPELPTVGRYHGVPAAEKLRRRDVQARVAGRFVREMVTYRDIHASRITERCAPSGEDRKKLRALLADPETPDLLLRALREERDLRDALPIIGGEEKP